MKKTLALVAAVLAVVPALAQPFDIRPGVWELTSKVANLPRPMVTRECVTRGDLGHVVHNPDLKEDDPCRPLGAAATATNTWSSELSCQDGSRVRADFSALTREWIAGKVVRSGGRFPKAQRLDVTGRWIAAVCPAAQR